MGGQRRGLFVTRKNHVASVFAKKLYATALRWLFICCIVTDAGSFMLELTASRFWGRGGPRGQSERFNNQEGGNNAGGADAANRARPACCSLAGRSRNRRGCVEPRWPSVGGQIERGTRGYGRVPSACRRPSDRAAGRRSREWRGSWRLTAYLSRIAGIRGTFRGIDPACRC